MSMNNLMKTMTEQKARKLAAPIRRRLEDTREAITHKFSINGHEGYIIVGIYPDGRPGELFVKMAKQGSTVSGLMDTIGILTSMTLQYGVSPETLARKMENMQFEPSGWNSNEDIRNAKSIVDYIFRWLGNQFSESYQASRQAVVPEDVSEET